MTSLILSMRASFFRTAGLSALLSMTVCVSVYGQLEKPQVWTLQRCLEHALEHNLQLQQAQLGLVRGALAETSAKGAFLPSLNASSSYGVNIGQRIDPFTNQFATDAVASSNYGMNSGLTLFNGFQNHLNLRRARLGLELAQANVDIAQNNLALNLASGYLNVLFQKEFLTISELNVEATDRQVDRIQKLVNAGAAAESDLFDVLAQQAADQSAVVGAQNGVTLAKLAMAQLLQLSGDEADQLDVAPPPDDLLETTMLPLSADAAVAYALSAFPDMKAAELQVTDATLGLDLAKAQRMPRLTGSYNVGSGYSELQIDPTTLETFPFQKQFITNLNQSIFFSLSLPIFNGFGIETNIDRSEVDVLSAQLAKEQAAQALTQTVEQAWADARAAQRTFEANDRALEAASLAMTNAEARFEAGAISALEYADARTRLDNARINALRTQYDFVFKTRILDFYLGRPLSL